MAAIFLSGARFWAPDAPAAVKHGLALGNSVPIWWWDGARFFLQFGRTRHSWRLLQVACDSGGAATLRAARQLKGVMIRLSAIQTLS